MNDRRDEVRDLRFAKVAVMAWVPGARPAALAVEQDGPALALRMRVRDTLRQWTSRSSGEYNGDDGDWLG